jgi:hypothetical protein
MALSGTLKDFGIADILQLIGHQTKTGSLLLRNQREEVEVSFVEGNVVFASEKTRSAHNFLGSMLVRAEVISDAQLEEALQGQQRSLRRLGDVLIELGFISEVALAQMTRLQTTETLYKLFRWKTGTYEFTQKDIETEKSGFDPIRAESILLEGFRRMDEWPAMRKKIPWDAATTERARELDVRDLPPMEGAFAPDGGGEGGDGGEGKPAARHKLIYRLAGPGRTTRAIVDLSRMGEFEALKAMQELVDWGYLRIVPPARGTAAAVQGLTAGGRALAASGALVRLAISVVFFVGTLFVVRTVAPAFGSPRGDVHGRSGAAARLLARDQILRLESALELYKIEHGEYPKELRLLVDGQLVADGDLRYPFPEAYYYRRTGQGAQQAFVLLPPLD